MNAPISDPAFRCPHCQQLIDIRVEKLRISIGALAAPSGRLMPTLDNIKQAVAEQYGVAMDQLTGRRRYRHLVIPRHVAFYLATELTRLSFNQIGLYFGERDHGTVTYGCRAIADQMAVYPETRQKVEALKARFQQPTRSINPNIVSEADDTHALQIWR